MFYKIQVFFLGGITFQENSVNQHVAENILCWITWNIGLGTSTIFKPVDRNFPYSWLRCSAKEFLSPFCCTADFVPFCCCCMELRNITIFSLCYLIARMIEIYKNFHIIWSRISRSIYIFSFMVTLAILTCRCKSCN